MTGLVKDPVALLQQKNIYLIAVGATVSRLECAGLKAEKMDSGSVGKYVA